MKQKLWQIMGLFLVVGFVLAVVLQSDASARVGGGRSLGSKGSRSYSRPASPYSQPTPSQQAAPQPRPYTPPPYQAPQPAGGGFFRSMAGGVLGGMLGGMLFRGLGFGGGLGGGFGGSGFGLFEIVLIAGICYLIFRMVSGRRQEAPAYQEPLRYGGASAEPAYQAPAAGGNPPDDVATGLAHIRQMDPAFDEERFTDQVMDIFFKIQAAWMHRDLTPVGGLVTDEIRRIFQEDIDRLLRERRANRLENIAVRSVEIVEAWQEAGHDYLTALIYANLLDYTVDDATGQVVAGSNSEPVKFEEYWTFARPVGNSGWKLTAIDQK